MNSSVRLRAVLCAVLAVVTVALVVGVFMNDRRSRAEAQTEASQYRPPPVPAPTVVFIGDSFTAGVGATQPERDWTSLVSAHEGWNEVNLAIGGTGYAETTPGCDPKQCTTFADTLARGVSYKPSIVVVSGGQNDSNVSPAKARSAVEAFFPELKKTFPNARLYVTSAVWGATGEVIPAVQALEGPIKEGAAKVGATYLPFGQPLQEHPELINPENGHPGDAGHRILARTIESELARIGVGNAP